LLSARQTKTEIGGYDSTREGAKGTKSFIIILFTLLGLILEKWLHELLGEAMWFFIAFNYIYPSLGLFGVAHSLIFNHWVPRPFLLICVLGMACKQMVRGRDPLLDGCK
jgi:hypothetical protein